MIDYGCSKNQNKCLSWRWIPLGDEAVAIMKFQKNETVYDIQLT